MRTFKDKPGTEAAGQNTGVGGYGSVNKWTRFRTRHRRFTRRRGVGVRIKRTGGTQYAGGGAGGLGGIKGVTIGLGIGILLAFAIAIPGWLPDGQQAETPIEWLTYEPYTPRQELQLSPNMPHVTVYLSADGTVESFPLEAYVRGVVAAEMPADFQPEALKAQAIASRTYIVKRLLAHQADNVPAVAAAAGAIVTDTVSHQAFKTEEALRRQWGPYEYAYKMDRLNQAVNETAGIIATYGGQPIDAAFFSTSNGYTENSEEYWANYVPYLRSVPSPWDAEVSPKYEQTTVLQADEVLLKLDVSPAVPVSSTEIQSVTYTTGKRVKSIRIGNREFTGRELREKLDLPSSHMQLQWKKDRLEITTYGYGHGVGMSQYGAEGMAREGRTAPEILKHYYTGIRLTKAPFDKILADQKNNANVLSHTNSLPE